MEEKKVSLIPRIVIESAMGPKEYGVLLTNIRSIFVLEKASKTTGGFLLGGVVGAAIAKSAEDPRTIIDYKNADIDSLVFKKDSMAIPYSAIESLRLSKGLGGYKLLLKYAASDNKVKKIKAIVAPSPELIKRKKEEGVKPKVAIEQYATKVEKAFKKALPLAVQQHAVWPA